jgi:uncharacterized protein (DUF2141 family)
MKISLLFIMLFGIFGIQGPGELRVTVSNIYPIDGDLYIAIDDQRENYMEPELAVFSKVVAVEAGTQSIIFTDIPDGEYAITVFQDLDDNEELNLSTFGIPREPYGFSNNVRGTMGPPKFDKAKFSFSSELEVAIALENDEAE